MSGAHPPRESETARDRVYTTNPVLGKPRLRPAGATIVGSRPASEILSQNQKTDKHIKPDHKPELGSWGWEVGVGVGEMTWEDQDQG